MTLRPFLSEKFAFSMFVFIISRRWILVHPFVNCVRLYFFFDTCSRRISRKQKILSKVLFTQLCPGLLDKCRKLRFGLPGRKPPGGLCPAESSDLLLHRAVSASFSFEPQGKTGCFKLKFSHPEEYASGCSGARFLISDNNIDGISQIGSHKHKPFPFSDSVVST